ncbi:MAG TPA: PilZ domain-containing protein [Nitrospira sp.]|jgi:PilZ domain|nr:PilZ domain-containing protein [Nitrospira sp.]
MPTKKNSDIAIERRHAVRVLAPFPITYVDEEADRTSLLTGLSRDLSETGCQIICPLPPAGRRITLILDLKDGRPPLNLADTNVRWSAAHQFGVMFPEMTAAERKRLRKIIQNRKTLF